MMALAQPDNSNKLLAAMSPPVSRGFVHACHVPQQIRRRQPRRPLRLRCLRPRRSSWIPPRLSDPMLATP